MNFDYDLSPYSAARLTLYNLRIIAHGDTCFIELTSNNGLTWNRVAAFSDTLAPPYHYAQFDITPYLRSFNHRYKIRFRFVSDGSINSVGAMFDNIGWDVDPVSGINGSNNELPRQLAYPKIIQPVQSRYEILFTLASKTNVRLEIYDVMGRLVKTLANKEMLPGSYNVTWSGDDANDIL